MIDYERATLLMDFIEAASKHGPTYSGLMAEAQAELKEMAEELKAEKTDEAKAEVERKAADTAKAQAETRRPAPKPTQEELDAADDNIERRAV